jgi:hypothetical protein
MVKDPEVLKCESILCELLETNKHLALASSQMSQKLCTGAWVGSVGRTRLLEDSGVREMSCGSQIPRDHGIRALELRFLMCKVRAKWIFSSQVQSKYRMK